MFYIVIFKYALPVYQYGIYYIAWSVLCSLTLSLHVTNLKFKIQLQWKLAITCHANIIIYN